MLACPTAPPRPPEEVTTLSRRAHQLTQQVVDQIDCGLLVCDGHGHVLHANRAARRELGSGQLLSLQDDLLFCEGPSAHELSVAILAAATRGLRRLVYLQDSPPLMLVVAPLEPQSGAEPLVLVMIGRRTLCTALGLELLALQHRLTWAEQRVLRGIVGGAAVRDIAADNGVAVSTIRTQVQSIRDKLGVNNIDALLLIAARIPPVPSCH
jgi:DNA-binding NarL/FixJ family response regulator